MSDIIVRFDSVSKFFPGVVANDSVNLEIARGEIHSLLGENGAGKSTLMNILYGLYKPDAGTVSIDGAPANILSPNDAIRHGIGMIHQHFMLIPTFTVWENVALGQKTEKSPLLSRARVREKVAEIAKAYHISIDVDALVGDLAVGTQQKVEILKAMYRGSRILILDEPTSWLTPKRMARKARNRPLPALIPNINIPVLSDLPVIGPMVFSQNILVYLALALFLLYAWFIRNTESGLALRAVGENPAAAQTAGIPVFRYRYVAVAVSGGLAALGGAYLTLSQISRFTENMVEGRGWIAIAAIILGKWTPYGTMGGCFLFGLAMAISNQLQTLNLGIPYQAALMVPYLMSMIALLGFGNKKLRGPAALGKPYMRNK